MNARNYVLSLKLTTHFALDPSAAGVTKIIRFTVPSVTSVLRQEVPICYSLSQNYPNPFNPSTKIRYSIADPGFVELKVFNAIGEEMVTLLNEYKNAGNYELDFDADELQSGIYFYRIASGNFISVKEFAVLK